jgi:hypothetical protein
LKALVAAAFGALLLGCGDGADLETVSGTVTLDGAPLAGAKLTLVRNPPPTTANTDPRVDGPFLGETNDQGQFTMGPIGDPGGGAPAGAFTLRITTAFAETFDENTVVPPERVPAPYPAGVDFEVPDGGKTDANFDLKSK